MDRTNCRFYLVKSRSRHSAHLIRLARSAYPEHRCAASWACTLSGGTTILHGDRLRTLDLSLALTLYTIRFHGFQLLVYCITRYLLSNILGLVNVLCNGFGVTSAIIVEYRYYNGVNTGKSYLWPGQLCPGQQSEFKLRCAGAVFYNLLLASRECCCDDIRSKKSLS